jgi:glycosyltransferase involved in cell wall biosynthesis
MRVLIVSKAQVVGSYEPRLHEIAALGIDLTVIVPPRWQNQVLEVRNPEGYKLQILPCWLSGHNHFHFYGGNLGPLNYDLVFIDEEPWSLVTHQLLRRCVREKRPTVLFTWQNIFKTYPPPFAYFERYSLRNADAIVAGNNEAKEILLRKGFQKPVRVIPQFGTDPDFFRRLPVSRKRAELGISKDDFVIGYVGRLLEEKGIADLIHSLRTLPTDCILLLIGSGPFGSRTRQIVSDAGIVGRVRWIAQVPSLEIPEYMNALNVLVLPSRTASNWKEQFGRVLIEAMACELPVVGSSSGEIPNVIGNSEFVYPEGDVPALAGILRNLHDNPDCGLVMGRKGRERVLQQFTHKHVAAKMVEFFKTVLHCRNTANRSRVCSA